MVLGPEALMKAYLFQKLLFVGIAATVLMLPMPLGAQSSEDVCIVRATIEPGIVTGLIAWIVTKTKWVAQQPPSICSVSHRQLLKIYDSDGSAPNDLQIHALYSIRNHNVYLVENWNPTDLHDRAALLHELVHHLQQLNNVKAPCLAANEPQAYHLEIEWVREQGIEDPYKFLDIDEFTISLLSQCQD
jgi:uncharacterized protein DUF6647